MPQNATHQIAMMALRSAAPVNGGFGPERVDRVPSAAMAASSSVLHGCAGSRKGRPVSLLWISPSCRTNTMPIVATILRGQSDA
jgi:hypothetical protein